MKKLPVSIETFKEIIENKYLYIDKTESIYNIIKNHKCCFLSRPRRFGKSLVLSTLDELFQGNRELFHGLWIDSSDYKFEKYPVVKLSLSVACNTPDVLSKRLCREVQRLAARHDIEIKATEPDDAIITLIEAIHDKYSAKVAVLIDEYDKPVISMIADLKLARANCEVLKTFFSPLKTLDDYIHKIFITGVTKCALSSASSSLNNLSDISLIPESAVLCGFTINELHKYFAELIDDVHGALIKQKSFLPSFSKKDLWIKIVDWYDGYNFGGNVHVFNPWSILNFFKYKAFKRYWSATGSSTIVSELIQKNPENYTNTRLASYTTEQLDTSDIGKLEPIPMLFTYGYLTLDKEYALDDGEVSYSLKIPNVEIKKYYHLAEMLGIFGLSKDKVNDYAKQFAKAIVSRNNLVIETIIGSNLSAIPAKFHKPEESFYHSVIHSFLNGLYMDPISEVFNSRGLTDLVLVLPDKKYVVVEIKYVKDNVNIKGKITKLTDVQKQKEIDKAATNALIQIEKNAYYKRFESQAKEIIKIGLIICGRDEVKVFFEDLAK